MIRFKKKDATAKFGNEPTFSSDGHNFSSKLEAAVYQLLKYRKMAGEIHKIEMQDHIYLTRARIHYIPDFKCTKHDGAVFHVESKGFANDRWPMKKKLWKYYGPNPLEIWMGTYQSPFLKEIIVPTGGNADE